MSVPRRIDQLVETEIRRWASSAGKPARRGCVAFSHEPGAQGPELARLVAERLGYALFDRALVEEIVRDQGIQKQLVETLDEHVRSLVERFVLGGFRRPGFSEGDYLESLSRVVHTLAGRGGVVLLGRGAPYLLSPAEALRVLVVAPIEARQARLGPERWKQDEERRREYLRHHFGVDHDDSARFDLAVNTETLGLEEAARLVAEASESRFGAMAEGGRS
jgi:hypothetical protein